MTIEQWNEMLERHGPWVTLLAFMCVWFWFQGWPWLRKFMEQRAAADLRRQKASEDREAQQRSELMALEAKHRADLMAVIAENSAYREQRLAVDQQVATAINGVTEMVRQLQLLDRVNEELAAIKERLGLRDFNNEPKSSGRRG